MLCFRGARSNGSIDSRRQRGPEKRKIRAGRSESLAWVLAKILRHCGSRHAAPRVLGKRFRRQKQIGESRQIVG
jgi:hypothetical protein